MYSKKLIVILGPTASGKTDLSIKLAKKLALSRTEGLNEVEIISADSRQVYRGLDVGSGKITKKQMQGIRHHLLDIASPKRKFTVAQYQKLVIKIIKKIHKKNKIPFLVGGTGFYIQSVVDGIVMPEVKPNWKLRKNLEKKNTEELFQMLLKLDPVRAQLIDKKNPRRLVRAIEIVLSTKKPIERLRNKSQFNTLQIGIKKSPKQLKKLIHKRLSKRIKKIVTEVKNLHNNGVSFKRLEELGLEYRFVAQYIQNKTSFDTAQDLSAYQEMINRIQKESEHFAKRQMTWFKRDKRISWVKNYKEANKLINKFLKNSYIPKPASGYSE